MDLFIVAPNRDQEDSLVAMGTNWHPTSIPNIPPASSNSLRNSGNIRPGSQGNQAGKTIPLV